MARTFVLKLDSNDLGQAIDGLEVRAQQWEDTARYMRTGESPNEFFMPEECRDAAEAENIARHYRSILRQIEEQVSRQHECREETQ